MSMQTKKESHQNGKLYRKHVRKAHIAEPKCVCAKVIKIYKVVEETDLIKNIHELKREEFEN